MTETAGPQGGPPPLAGRGLWSEAFRGEMREEEEEEVVLGGLSRLSTQTQANQNSNLNT